ncbi:SGNH/GDSL hydrolase family protein [Kitasatospora sp. NBC_01287]|uniref:SGNH/GDSL hydrolase family protein n=1 Tax=Kitasatospora sp. NBC_01287 TaxID=2903573 RepID=UPI00224EC9F0|nr:SGNH/GDSL hydrolase family protein [Kitasatospora sp. NBC_01287]MCX4750141.1 SGNH/GDSL hydrolase family protein [Kitasatospora sp. NBC_01287]
MIPLRTAAPRHRPLAHHGAPAGRRTAARRRAAAALAALPLLLLAAAAPAAADRPGYVALGDSYAAGVAAGAYDPASGDCHRSSRAYPALWAAAHPDGGFLDLACSGADTAEVLAHQLPRLPAGTGTVTLTVGGNDLDFTDAVVGCLQPLTTEAKCTQALDHAAELLRDQLPGRLDHLLGAIDQAAPAARVVLTGYPHLLQEQAAGSCWAGTDDRRARFNQLTDRLDDLIQQQAAAHGARFADPRPAFTGHGVCAAHGTEWITGLVLLDLWESFHPTADGQSQGYLPPVAQALGG